VSVLRFMAGDGHAGGLDPADEEDAGGDLGGVQVHVLRRARGRSGDGLIVQLGAVRGVGVVKDDAVVDGELVGLPGVGQLAHVRRGRRRWVVSDQDKAEANRKLVAEFAKKVLVDADYSVLRQAHDYAARLGHSLTSLNRACQRATGHTAKRLIDARVALEAKRLLAHADLPVAAIGRRLGFTEPTNFGRFFARARGRPRGAFRDAVGGTAIKIVILPT
jgi:AraC-like DNA-binding protein